MTLGDPFDPTHLGPMAIKSAANARIPTTLLATHASLIPVFRFGDFRSRLDTVV